MKRKLPPDREVAALHESGMTYREIADRYGVNIQQVLQAMHRWKGTPVTHQKRIAALHEDRRFVAAGSQPVDHRETHWSQTKSTDDLAGAFKPLRTSLDDCRDLLREWGAI